MPGTRGFDLRTPLAAPARTRRFGHSCKPDAASINVQRFSERYHQRRFRASAARSGLPRKIYNGRGRILLPADERDRMGSLCDMPNGSDAILLTDVHPEHDSQ